MGQIQQATERSLEVSGVAHAYAQAMANVLDAIPLDAVSSLAGAIFDATVSGGTVLVFGNGGRAATSDHIACDLTKNTRVAGAPAVRCLSLCSMVGLSTAVANDHGYDRVFAEPIAALGRKGDLALAISTSGNSRNIIAALKEARGMGMTTAALLGFTGGDARDLTDLSVIVRHESVPHLEDSHNVINHMLTECVRSMLADSIFKSP